MINLSLSMLILGEYPEIDHSLFLTDSYLFITDNHRPLSFDFVCFSQLKSINKEVNY